MVGASALVSKFMAEEQEYEHHHRNVQSGGARAAMFGVSDGLVTNISLILGVAGAHPVAGVVRLAGLAGLVAGAFSMSAGELVSMRAQKELLQRELSVERHAIAMHADEEREELARTYEERGFSRDLSLRVADEAMSNPELALEMHAREELGIDPRSLGSPWLASAASFVSFAVGAIVPLLPWLLTAGMVATVWSLVATGVAALVVGGVLAQFTGRRMLFSSLRQLVVTGVVAAAAWGIGHAFGSVGSTRSL
ncbi:MAG: VIT1/CCC1 transporter family protein [Actinobacteria bacterium]|nr:VIT1/CCC1 transporter family protein [Actinomycetota bacterium]MCL5446336.1 VIT1/CCC1 transporter family protein [Actinomycetota bacterium]